MKKTFIALSLILLFAMSLAGCSKKEGKISFEAKEEEGQQITEEKEESQKVIEEKEETSGFNVLELFEGDDVIQSMSMGKDHSCVAKGKKSYCWGMNGYGSLGENVSKIANQEKTRYGISELPSRIVKMSLGDSFTCALLEDGKVYCWGSNRYGQLGNSQNLGTGEMNGVPTVVDLADKAVDIEASFSNVCATTESGSLYCWGDNYYGHLATFDDSSYHKPHLPTKINLESEVEKVSMGYYHACAMTTDNKVYCWGGNKYKQIADVSKENIFDPQEIDFEGKPASVAVGGGETCVELANKKELYCLGNNGFTANQKFDTTERMRSKSDNSIFSDLRHGGSDLCGVTERKTLECWEKELKSKGWKLDGSVKIMTLNSSGVCYVSEDDSIYCKGNNKRGQLGLSEKEKISSFEELKLKDIFGDKY